MIRSLAHLVSASFCGGLAVTASMLAAECSELHRDRIPNPHGSQIRVVAESAGAPVEHDAIARAVAMWSSTCAGSVPRFAAQGNIVMRLRFHDGANDIPGCGDGCACTIANTLPAPRGGEYLASSITHLFERHRDGRGYCRAHRHETLAHEIGHVLGFRHPDDPYGAECAGLIMSFSPNRSVRPADCRALGSLWRLRWLPDSPQTIEGPETQSRAAEAEGALKDPQEP